MVEAVVSNNVISAVHVVDAALLSVAVSVTVTVPICEQSNANWSRLRLSRPVHGSKLPLSTPFT